MPLKPAIGESMKAVAHHQQLKAPPSSLNGIEPIGIIDLTAELADDSLDDVRGARHSRMIEVGKEKGHLVLEGEDLSLQPTISQGLSSSLPDPKPKAKLLFGVDVKEPGSQPQEDLDASTRTFVQIAEIMLEVLLPMAHAELQGKAREKLPAGAKEPRIAIDDKASERIADFVSEGVKHRLPVFRGFDRCETRQRDILRGGIGTEQKRVAVAFNVDGFPIKQQIAAPTGLEFLSDLHEAFAVLSQGIDPLEDSVGAHMEFAAHSAVGSFPIEVKMSGARDEARLVPDTLWGSLSLCDKRCFTVMAPPALNLARPQPIRCRVVSEIGCVSLGRKSTAGWTSFFSSSCPPMVRLTHHRSE